MSIASQASEDFKKIIARDCGDVTITLSDESEHVLAAFDIRVHVNVDPETKAVFEEPVSTASVSTKELPGQPDYDWQISLTDTNGDTIEGRLTTWRDNPTLGRTRLVIEVNENE